MEQNFVLFTDGLATANVAIARIVNATTLTWMWSQHREDAKIKTTKISSKFAPAKVSHYNIMVTSR